MHDLDHTQRFLFDDNDVRGEMVSLAESYQHVLAKHPYPQPVAQLLGEMLAAAALLVGTLKFEGLLILQAGPVVLRFVPPLNIGDVDVAEGLTRLRAALVAYRAARAQQA